MDKTTDLLAGLTIAEGLTLQKVEMELDGVRTEIADPKSFTQEFPGTINIILTLSRTDGSTIEVKSDSLTINALEYNPITPQEANIYENRNEWKKNVE